MIILIAAIGRNNELGKNGDLCFRLKADLKFFQAMTDGHKIVMGYKTFISLPKRLTNREYYVVTHNPEKLPQWVHHVDDLKAFLKANAGTEEEVFVIGGGNVYGQALDFADRLYLTRIRASDPEADTFFPNYHKGRYWYVDRIISGEENNVGYDIMMYERPQ